MKSYQAARCARPFKRIGLWKCTQRTCNRCGKELAQLSEWDRRRIEAMASVLRDTVRELPAHGKMAVALVCAEIAAGEL